MSAPLTVWGVAAKVDEIAAHYDAWGRLTSAHTVKDFDPDLPDNPIRVTFRHDPTLEIGDLVHAELDADGRLLAVAVLDDDQLAEHEGRLFYSPDYTGYGRNMGARTFTANRASITGMSVTPSPAGFAAKRSPLKMLPGDLRRSIDRFSMWPSGWRSDPLLKRAVDSLPRVSAEEHRATNIVDRRVTDEMREQMHYAQSAKELGLSRGRIGHIEFSGHRGRVLAVEGRPPRGD